jgi:hypothetical protein
MAAQAEKLEAAMGGIEKGSAKNPETIGLEAAVGGLQSALRVVEGGNRTTPEQAIEVYRLSDEAAKSRIAEWKRLKGGELKEFNRSLEKSGVAPIKVSQIDVAVELPVTQ